MESTNAPSHAKRKKIGIALGAVVVFLVAVVAIFAGKKSAAPAASNDTPSSDTPDASSENPSTVVAATSTASSSAASQDAYKDGTYSATGSYFSPGGQDHIAVTLTIANDIVTDASVTPEPGDNTSARYQAKFVSGYKQYVVGQNIADIHLTKVSGSSLTPEGFDDALAQIKSQAAA